VKGGEYCLIFERKQVVFPKKIVKMTEIGLVLYKWKKM